MNKSKLIILFNQKQVRRSWDEKNEIWYFSIIDVVEILTDSPRPRKYWNALKTKLKQEGSELSQKVGQLKLEFADGKKYLTDVAIVRLDWNGEDKKWLLTAFTKLKNEINPPVGGSPATFIPSGEVTRLRDKNIIPRILKKSKPDEKEAFGVLAGLEPEHDDNGNIKGFKFNPEKLAAQLKTFFFCIT